METIDFIGIGAAKSGSSWVGAVLAEHPQINVPKDKSMFFFNTDYGNEYEKDNWSNWDKGLDWYYAQFALPEKGKIRGEFGVSYLNDPEAPNRIKKHFPNTKILVTLRNPVDMIYSLYWYCVNTVEIKAPDTFEEAVEKEWCLDRGNYYKYLNRFYKLFPKENIHVVIFDDIKSNPQKVAKDLYSFLEVDNTFVPSILDEKVYSSISHKNVLLKQIGFSFFALLKKLNLERVRRFFLDNRIFYAIYYKINVTHKKYPKMSEEMRTVLKKYYLADIKKLEKLLNRDLSLWK